MLTRSALVADAPDTSFAVWAGTMRQRRYGALHLEESDGPQLAADDTDDGLEAGWVCEVFARLGAPPLAGSLDTF